MDEQIKRLQEQRQKTWKDMSDILDAARGESRGLTAEESQRYDALETELDKATEELERLQRHQSRAADLEQPRRDVRLLPGGDRVRERQEEEPSADEYRAAFSAWLRSTERTMDLTADQRRVLRGGFRTNNDGQRETRAALGTTSGGVGGYLIPQGFADVLVRARLQFGGMLQANTRKFTTDTGNTLPIPMVNDTGNVGALLSENTQITEQEPTFTSKNLGAYTFTSKLILVSYQMLQDSYFDLEAFIGSIAGERLGRSQNSYLTTGTGTSQPQGIVTGATVGVTAATGGTTTVTYANLVDLVHAVDPAYRMGAEFMFHDSTLKAIRKLEDSQNRPLWNPGYAPGADLGAVPPSILDFSYTINQDMPVMAANAKSIVFGDMSSYWIREVKDVTLIRLDERYADYLQVGFFAFQRLDGCLVDAGTHPVAVFQNSAT